MYVVVGHARIGSPWHVEKGAVDRLIVVIYYSVFFTYLY